MTKIQCFIHKIDSEFTKGSHTRHFDRNIGHSKGLEA